MTLAKRLRAAWNAFRNPEGAKAAGETDEPNDSTLEERLNRLKQRAVSGREAWRCCVRAKRQAQGVFYQLENAVDVFKDAWEKMQPTQALVVPMSPSVVSSMEMGWAAVTGALGINVSWTTRRLVIPWAEDLMIPKTDTEATLVKQWLRIGAETVRKTEEDCIDCVERKVFGQSTPRKNFRLAGVAGRSGKIRRRVPGGARP